MDIKLSMRRADKACEISALVKDRQEAQTLGEAILSFLRLSGHNVEFECDDENGEGCPSLALKCLRDKRNLTQGEFAQKIGVTQNVVSDMERGARTISVKTAKRIEKIFGVPYRRFL
ncbi:MAG: helix-turn-helix domain-containing protein [Helicobacteraceae bacterium]|jgi:DNA-binding XRE family transcriptional regulator|nr:helix-turn-helix domain-containing protein [Helicobacteraceae bacterium]